MATNYLRYRFVPELARDAAFTQIDGVIEDVVRTLTLASSTSTSGTIRIAAGATSAYAFTTLRACLVVPIDYDVVVKHAVADAGVRVPAGGMYFFQASATSPPNALRVTNTDGANVASVLLVTLGT